MIDNDIINNLKTNTYNNFISKINYIIPNNEKYELCFIDGGNSEIISSPNLSLQAIKIVALILKNNKIKDIKYKKEIILIKKNEEQYEIIENNKSFFLKINKNIQEIGNIIRNLKELTLYSELQDQFEGLVIKDGNFETFTELEKDKILKLKYFCGLSKTSQEQELTPYHNIKDCWYSNKKDFFIIKLNNHSIYSFKLELKNLEINNVMQKLISNSNDYIYPGYPYGLILVDRLARVSNNEITNLKAYLEIKLGKNWKKIKELENSVNAHKILDKLIF